MAERHVGKPNLTRNERAMMLVYQQCPNWYWFAAPLSEGELPPLWWALRRRGCEVMITTVEGKRWLKARWTHGEVEAVKL